MTGIKHRAEVWRPVPGWPCKASSLGRVLGPSGKVLKPYNSKSGHLHVLIRGRKLRVHHAILVAFVGPRPPGKECRHLDDDPANNYPHWGEYQAAIRRHMAPLVEAMIGNLPEELKLLVLDALARYDRVTDEQAPT
jgi:hypothetical protein